MAASTLFLAAVCTAPAHADVITLTFEGINGAAVGGFYDGGAGGDLGIRFSPAAFGLVDSDAGGGGFFANEPSPSTVLHFSGSEEGGVPHMNVTGGFRNRVEFFYSQPLTDEADVVFSHFQVAAFSGSNGTGRRLGHWTLPSTRPSAAGDPTGDLFGEFVKFSGSFRGRARSLTWIEPTNLTGAVFDNLQLDTAAPTPEPATLWLLGTAVSALAGAERRRRRSS